MCREKDSKERKTGNRVILSISCLLLLSGMVMLFTYMVGKGLEKKEYVADLEDTMIEKEDSSIFRKAGGFDNYIDDLYLPVIFEKSENDKIAVLKSYETAWKEQLERYTADFKSRCKYVGDKEMVDEYLDAIQMAVETQKDFMEYMGVEEEKQLWYSAQIYRCAFVKDIKGEVDSNGADGIVMHVSLQETQSIPDLNYEMCGEFANEIDRQYVLSMHYGSEIEVRGRQEAFDLDWCNQLAEITMEFYKNLDEEGKALMGIWQESRENWKSASNSRFWASPEMLNSEAEDTLFWGTGTSAGLLEKDGWINRLYYLQLQSIMESKLDKTRN